jgi:hypothetical protein
MKRKQMLGLIVMVIVLGMAFTSLLIQGASAINMTVSGDVVSNEYRADFTGQTFLGDEILTSEFYYNWTSGEGFIKIYTLKGLVTISMEDAEYDPLSYKFTIKKFTCTYPTGYPYKITLSQIWGDQTSSTFTGYMVGSYTETGSSEEEEEEEECEIDVNFENNANSKSLYVEVRADKDISSAGAVFYAVGGGSTASNFNKLSDRLYFTDFPYYDVAVQRFTVAITFKDGSSKTSGPFTVSSSTGTGWPSGSGTTTTGNDYSTSLAKAKANGFTTVMAYITDMNASITSKNAQIQAQQSTLATRNSEIATLTADNNNYKSNYILKSTYDNLLSNYNKLQSDYNALQGNGGAVQPSTPTKVDVQMIAKVIAVLVVIAVAVIGYRKLKGRKGKKRFPKMPPVEEEQGIPTEDKFTDGNYDVNETIKNIEFHYDKYYPENNVKPKKRIWNKL